MACPGESSNALEVIVNTRSTLGVPLRSGAKTETAGGKAWRVVSPCEAPETARPLEVGQPRRAVGGRRRRRRGGGGARQRLPRPRVPGRQRGRRWEAPGGVSFGPGLLPASSVRYVAQEAFQDDHSTFPVGRNFPEIGPDLTPDAGRSWPSLGGRRRSISGQLRSTSGESGRIPACFGRCRCSVGRVRANDHSNLADAGQTLNDVGPTFALFLGRLWSKLVDCGPASGYLLAHVWHIWAQLDRVRPLPAPFRPNLSKSAEGRWGVVALNKFY